MSLSAIDFGNAQDHDGLVDEHFIYACDILLLLLAHIFNKPCEGFSTRWIEHTIVPILKCGDLMMPNNYRTIMIEKLYVSILQSELSIWAREITAV